MLNYKKIGFGFLNIIIYIFLTAIITSLLGDFKFTQNIWILNLYLLISPMVVLIILILLNKDLFKNKWQDIKENKKKYFELALKYYICGLILMLISNLILTFFTKSIPQNESDNRALLELMPIYAIISMIILAPLSEELTFRGSFKKITQNKYLFLIITSFLFGFMHVVFNGDYLNFIPYAALGFFLGKVYYETDNIFVSTLIHSFHNLLCILLIFIGGAL